MNPTPQVRSEEMGESDTAVRERPILFSGEMVRAILDGRKTQTRRIVKPQPSGDIPDEHLAFTAWNESWSTHDARDPEPSVVDEWMCPYGYVGQRLWVRETWQPFYGDGLESAAVLYAASFNEKDPRSAYLQDAVRDFTVPYDVADKHLQMIRRDEVLGDKWRPSIHMPRWASRITLEVTGIRIERLNDISGKDAEAEGCDPDWEAFHDRTEGMEGWEQPEEFIEECEEECDWINFGRNLVHSREHQQWQRDRKDYALRLAFRGLWESINGPASWAVNPWVWAISFKKLEAI